MELFEEIPPPTEFDREEVRRVRKDPSRTIRSNETAALGEIRKIFGWSSAWRRRMESAARELGVEADSGEAFQFATHGRFPVRFVGSSISRPLPDPSVLWSAKKAEKLPIISEFLDVFLQEDGFIDPSSALTARQIGIGLLMIRPAKEPVSRRSFGFGSVFWTGGEVAKEIQILRWLDYLEGLRDLGWRLEV